jgi:glycosyltransferase involved in cell wall biosynthesis
VSAPTVYLNGKFTAQRITGVQRYAGELVRAVDQAATADENWVLLVPPQGRAPVLRTIETRRIGATHMPLHVWEQLCLPLAARDGLLVNLAGSAPLFASRQWCAFHDAAVFDHPDVYAPLFRRWYRFHFRWLARRAQRIITVSEHSRSRLALRLGVAEAAIAVVPNGGDHMLGIQSEPGIVKRLGLQGRRYLLAVGSHSRLKNWPALIRAWDLLNPQPDCALVMVGSRDGSVFASLAGGISATNVVHAGSVSDGELKALIVAEGALGLVFPSLDEGFGLPPLEAMTLGCPVAVSRAGAMPEVCGDAALYFDPLDDRSIQAALLRLLTEPGLRADLSRRGPPHAAAWTWQRAGQRLASLLASDAGTGLQR